MALTCIVLESIPVKLKLAEHTGVGSYSFPAASPNHCSQPWTAADTTLGWQITEKQLREKGKQVLEFVCVCALFRLRRADLLGKLTECGY